MLLGFKCIDVDMFPRTDKRRKNVMISFRLRQKHKKCGGYVPRYERIPKTLWFHNPCRDNRVNVKKNITKNKP